MGLSYRKFRSITFNHNRDDAKLQRQWASAKLIEFMFMGKVIVNIDETILKSTDARNKSWLPLNQDLMVS